MKIPKQLIDLTDKKFGRLIVLSYVGCNRPDRIKKKNHQWKCECDCGNKTVVLGDNLRSGKTSSCGCLQKEQTSKARRIDLTGNVFGRLTALEFSHSDENEQSFWLCECECGNTKTINSASLRRGDSKSCGCKQGNFTHGMWGKPGYKSHYLKDPVKKIKHGVGCSVRKALIKNNSSKNGGRTFDHLPYTPLELKEHLENQFEDWMSWNNYGGPSNSLEKTWQIDHIKPQSSFSYTSLSDPEFVECWSLENLRPLEKIQNMSEGAR